MRVLITGVVQQDRQRRRRAAARRRARGHRHRPAPLARRPRRRRDARGRHPQARRRGRVPQDPARGGRPHGDGDPPRRAQRGPLPHQPGRHPRRLRSRRAPTACSQVVFVGRHTYYGAAPDSPLYHTEDEPPMAMPTFPELGDLGRRRSLRDDRALALARARARRCCASATRSARRGTGTLCAYLRGAARARPSSASIPLFQFMHERDVARAICSRWRSGCAASSTSPARSRCRSR